MTSDAAVSAASAAGFTSINVDFDGDGVVTVAVVRMMVF